MLSVFLLLDWGVKPLWPVMGFPMLLWVCDLGFVSLKREMRYMYGHSLYFTVIFYSLLNVYVPFICYFVCVLFIFFAVFFSFVLFDYVSSNSCVPVKKNPSFVNNESSQSESLPSP